MAGGRQARRCFCRNVAAFARVLMRMLMLAWFSAPRLRPAYGHTPPMIAAVIKAGKRRRTAVTVSARAKRGAAARRECYAIDEYSPPGMPLRSFPPPACAQQLLARTYDGKAPRMPRRHARRVSGVARRPCAVVRRSVNAARMILYMPAHAVPPPPPSW